MDPYNEDSKVNFDSATHTIEQFDDLVDEQVTPEECLIRASLLLTQDSPSAVTVAQAAALVSLGRELRIGVKNRYIGYDMVHRQVLRVGQRIVEKPRPAAVHSVAEAAEQDREAEALSVQANGQFNLDD